jgi:hypothetical protein
VTVHGLHDTVVVPPEVVVVIVPSPVTVDVVPEGSVNVPVPPTVVVSPEVVLVIVPSPVTVYVVFEVSVNVPVASPDTVVVLPEVSLVTLASPVTLEVLPPRVLRVALPVALVVVPSVVVSPSTLTLVPWTLTDPLVASAGAAVVSDAATSPATITGFIGIISFPFHEGA